MRLRLALILATLGPATATAGPTFSKDVAPILWKNCAGCHRPGEVGPFSLLTFKDAARRAEFLKEITGSRRMPPWKPEPGFGQLLDDRRLSETDLKTIGAWADAGAPEGDPRDLPPAPKFPEGWRLGTPDLILTMPEPFTVPADGRDIQRCFVIPIPIDADKTVAAVEFRPGNRRVVHHSILYLAATGSARAKDQSDPGPGFASFGGPGVPINGGLGGWAPGAAPRPLPEGTGRLLRAGTDLIMQIHYHPVGKPETDRSTVGLTFSKGPVGKYVGGIMVRSRDLNIPAGEAHHQVEAASAPLVADATVIGITPHMHNLGRAMKVVADTPDGKTIPLIWIKDWDFNWQGQYQYREPIRLPKGSIVKVEASYNNSASNPNNPSKPPRAVHWGEQTTDEMCLLSLQITADSNADLVRMVRAHGMGAALARLGAATPKGAMTKGAMTKGANPAGFLIPEALKARIGQFDTNGDGRLSTAEVDAMPEPGRTRIRQAVQARMGGGTP